LKKSKKIAKFFSARRILIAVIIGLIVSIILLFRDFEIQKYANLNWGYVATFNLLISIILIGIRDLAYIYRLRVLLENKILWRNSLQVILLWEFASALTPSVVGGSAVAVYIVSKEVNSLGKSTAIVMLTALLDELFYIVMVPILYLFITSQKLFIISDFSIFNLGMMSTKSIFLIGYIFILFLTSLIAFAIFVKPEAFKRVIIGLFSTKLLIRWQKKAIKVGEDVVITSSEIKGKSKGFWIKAIGATFISWTARFLVVNFLIMAFVGGGDQLLIYSRQLIMWVILLISPTPGGSGIAEYILPKFLGQWMGNFGNEIALVWRLISYYSYLIFGAIVLPLWLKRNFKKYSKS